MAKKGQKFNNYTKEQKEEILKKYYEEFVPTTVLGREYGISEKTIQNWVYQQRQGKDVLTDTRKSRKGRPKKKTDEIDYKERYEIFCNKLLLERQYSAACFTTTSFSEEEITYNFPREHLSFEAFAVSMLSAALSHFIRR